MAWGGGVNTGVGAVAVSEAGDLIVWSGGGNIVELTWIDRAGRRGDVVSPAVNVHSFGLSADGRRLALGVFGAAGAQDNDISTLAVPGGTPSKFTFGPAPGWSFPVWSPDGTEIIYATMDSAGLTGYELHRRKSDMTGTEETLAKSDTILRPWDWSPDAKHLVYSSDNALWQLPLEAKEGKRTPIQLTTEPADEQYGQLSPFRSPPSTTSTGTPISPRRTGSDS